MSRLSSFALALLLLALPASAKHKDPVRDRGVLTEMQSVSCGTMQKTGSTVAGVLITGAQHTQSRELLCQEYVLKADRVTYRIRPKDEKHPVLLRVGDEAEFRLKKDELLLRVPDGDNKEREYIVVSMTASPDFTAELNQARRPPKPHRTKLSIDSDQTPVPSPAAPQTAASAPSLKIDSTPPGAEIFIDSASAGRTPALVNLSTGIHSVQIVLQGYKDWVTNVNVTASQQQITANLTH